MMKKRMEKVVSLVALLLCLGTAPGLAVNEKPFVIPELRSWQGGEGTFTLTPKSRIMVADGQSEKQVAYALAADYQEMFGRKLKVVVGKDAQTAKAGDIVIDLKGQTSLGREGYTVAITDRVVLSAHNVAGAYWGTRTLLQIWEQNEGMRLPQGRITDSPDYPVRGFMIDCGRKYIPLDYLRKYTKIMAYYKMNTLQVHLNDNGFPKFFHNNWDETYAAFRMESDFFPELTARDGHYGKQEFRDFQLEAAGHFVEIIPEIDVPAHSLAFTHYRKEFGTPEFGVDHLDLFNPNIYPFLDSLFTEYLGGDEPVFVGKRVHIGTDEYSNRKKEVVEKFRSFTDRYIRFVEQFGKQAVVWGSLTHAKGETPVKSDNVLMSLWNNGFANPQDMLDQGFQLISISDGHTYIVPAAGYYYDYLNNRFLYEHWAPHNIGGVMFEKKHPGIVGGMYAVWNDVVGNGISVKDIHHRCFPALQVIATKAWTSDVTFPYEQFESRRLLLSEAPDVNELGRIGKDRSAACTYTEAEVKPGKVYPHEEVGYDYSVSFDIEYQAEEAGTELFRSANAVFYLADPVSGMLGFSRDGYLNTFKYSVRPGRKERLRIEGDNRSTRLYVNGKLFEELGYDQRLAADKAPWNYVRTLFFPLRKSGDFKSRITNLQVSNRCLSAAEGQE